MKRIIIPILLLLVIVTAYLIYNNNSKIHLSEKYYNKGIYINIKTADLNSLNKENYLLFTYNSYCTFKIPCEKIFKETMDKYKIDVLSMPIEEFKKTKYYKKVKYAPTIIVVKNNKIKAYLDPNSNEDLDKYQKASEFEKWLSKYMYLEK